MKFNEIDAAEFIKKELAKQGKEVDTETILLMLEYEIEYMVSIGLAEHMG